MGAEMSIEVGGLYGRPREGGLQLARVTAVGPEPVICYDLVDHYGARIQSGIWEGPGFAADWYLVIHADVWQSYQGLVAKASDSDHQPPDAGLAHRMSCAATSGDPCNCRAVA